MVSWFHLFNFNWDSFEQPFSPMNDDYIQAAFSAGFERQAAFGSLMAREDRMIALKEWSVDTSGGPGVLLVIRGKKNEDARGLIDVIHHLKPWKDEDDDLISMGLSSFDSSAHVVAIKVEELLDELVPQKKLLQTSVRDRFPPICRRSHVWKIQDQGEIYSPIAG